ncbi:MAG: hypothetical protein HUJ25_06800 [Crocinitomicaceae bacterium]|nr:hypothetical protein [Crocinitomicaceae bacterium]
MKWYLFICIFSLSSIGWTQTPSDLKIYAGGGFPDFLHVGLRYNIPKFHFDASAGSTFGGQFTLSGNGAYHFGTKAIPQGEIQKPLFLSLGGSYVTYSSSSAYGQDVYINARFGGDIRFKPWFHLVLSAGLGVNVYHYKYDKEPSGWNFDIYLPVIPNARILLSFRLAKFHKQKDISE